MALKAKKKKGYGSGASLIPEATDSPYKPFNVNGPSVGAVTPQAPRWSPAPSDSGLEQQYSTYDQQAQNATAGYRQQAGDLLRDYGYAADPNNPYSFVADPNNPYGFDPTNPFSKAALLKQSFDRANAGNTNSYAARGQLYSGALRRMQDKSLNDYQAGNNTLLNSLRGNLGALNQAELGVGAQLAGQKANAYQAFLDRQIALRPPDPVPSYDPSLPLISSRPAPALKASDTRREGSSRTLGKRKKKR